MSQVKWRTYSPLNKSFRISLPKDSEIANLPHHPGEESIGLFNDHKLSEVYSLQLKGDSSAKSLGVVEFFPKKPYVSNDFDKLVNSYMLFLFGDDKTFTRESDVIVNGYHGREFIFKKGSGSGRAVFLNTGMRIYFLQYYKEMDAQPNSDLINRIFSSFEPKP